MTKIYDQHREAFRYVSAFVILKHGERVATIALKLPKDGAGGLFAYVHCFGFEMVRGYAGGYGYDKRSAAVENAMANMRSKATTANAFDLSSALSEIGGNTWDRALQDAGYTVLQAV
jgi:hypothetical protein